VRETGEGRILSLSKPTLDFLEQVLDCAQRHDIRRLIFVTSIKVERLMLRAAVPVHRIAPPALVDGQLTVALFIEVEKEKAKEKALAAAPATLTLDMTHPDATGVAA
jgi:N-acyl-L-homoserine lactone synthetase